MLAVRECKPRFAGLFLSGLEKFLCIKLIPDDQIFGHPPKVRFAPKAP